MTTNNDPIYSYVPGSGWVPSCTVIPTGTAIRIIGGQKYRVTVEMRDIKAGENAYWIDVDDDLNNVARNVGLYRGKFGWLAEMDIPCKEKDPIVAVFMEPL